jgi:hypothetical protein
VDRTVLTLAGTECTVAGEKGYCSGYGEGCQVYGGDDGVSLCEQAGESWGVTYGYTGEVCHFKGDSTCKVQCERESTSSWPKSGGLCESQNQDGCVSTLSLERAVLGTASQLKLSSSSPVCVLLLSVGWRCSDRSVLLAMPKRVTKRTDDVPQ